MIRMAELAKSLVEKMGLKQEEADFFVSQMFEALNEGLQQDRQVKVKGLGTFKLTSVGPRESVDVNTGERIVIDGRDKISFTPDTMLKDRVNAPFAQFETVAVKDGVDFTEIDERHKDELEEEAPQAEDRPIPAVQEPDGISVEEESAMAASAPAAQLEKEPVSPQAVDQDISPAEPLRLDAVQLSIINGGEVVVEETPTPQEDEEEELLPVEFVEEPEPAVQKEAAPVMSEPDSPASKEEEPQVAPMPSPVTDMKVNLAGSEEEASGHEVIALADMGQELSGQLRHARRLVHALLGILIGLLVLACIAAFFIGHELAVRDNRIAHLEAQTELLKAEIEKLKVQDSTSQKEVERKNSLEVPAERAANQDSVGKAPREDTNPVDAPAVQESRSQSQKLVTEKQPEAPKATPAQAKETVAKKAAGGTADYDKDPRIRLGAYRIVGVAQTVTVRKGQTLKSISRAHLGPDMECYMEALNGTGELKEGDQVKIPELKLKKKSAK